METEANSSSESTQSTIDAKISADLKTLEEKMELCHSMLHPSDGSPAPSLKNNDSLLGVIGFLEACAPRMIELVEAAAQGALSEDVLCQCLSVNDQLLKQLADIDTYSFTETPASTTAAAAPTTNLEDDMDDLLLDEGGKVDLFGLHVVSGKSTGDDDPFNHDLLGLNASSVEDGKKPAADSKAVTAAEPKDEFDDFLADRTKT